MTRPGDQSGASRNFIGIVNDAHQIPWRFPAHSRVHGVHIDSRVVQTLDKLLKPHTDLHAVQICFDDQLAADSLHLTSKP